MRFVQVTAIFVVILSISKCTTTHHPNDKKLVVSLYYESLCPDCIEFVSKQISKAWRSIGNYFDIEFVPYGNAHTIPTSPPTFKCQHGKSECDGNKMHACAIKYLPKANITDFIVCTMSTKDPPNAGYECARSLNVDFSPIQMCIATDEGDRLMYGYGVQTENLEPPHQYVPWILFDGKFDEEDNQKADKDLFRVICTKLRHAPDVCNDVNFVPIK